MDPAGDPGRIREVIAWRQGNCSVGEAIRSTLSHQRLQRRCQHSLGSEFCRNSATWLILERSTFSTRHLYRPKSANWTRRISRMPSAWMTWVEVSSGRTSWSSLYQRTEGLGEPCMAQGSMATSSRWTDTSWGSSSKDLARSAEEEGRDFIMLRDGSPDWNDLLPIDRWKVRVRLHVGIMKVLEKGKNGWKSVAKSPSNLGAYSAL